MAGRIGIIAGAILTAIIFGLVHGDPVLFPTLAALGLVTALAYAATGNLWVPITLHILNNALGAAFLVVETRFSGNEARSGRTDRRPQFGEEHAFSRERSGQLVQERHDFRIVGRSCE